MQDTFTKNYLKCWEKLKEKEINGEIYIVFELDVSSPKLMYIPNKVSSGFAT